MYNNKKLTWSRIFRTWISILHFAFPIYFWLKMCYCHSKMCKHILTIIFCQNCHLLKFEESFDMRISKKYKQKGYHYFTHLKHFAVFLNLHWFYLFPYDILHQTKTVFDGQNYAFDNLSCINDFLLHKKMRNDWQWVNINSEGEFLFSCTCIFTRFLWKESFYGQINLIYKTIGIFIWECRTVNRKCISKHHIRFWCQENGTQR